MEFKSDGPAHQEARFIAKLFRTPGKGGWFFVAVPAEFAPPVTGSWGMTPVNASVDGRKWDTTVWHDKKGGCYLPVPKKVRGPKVEGDAVEVVFRMDLKRAGQRPAYGESGW